MNNDIIHVQNYIPGTDLLVSSSDRECSLARKNQYARRHHSDNGISDRSNFQIY